MLLLQFLTILFPYKFFDKQFGGTFKVPIFQRFCCQYPLINYLDNHECLNVIQRYILDLSIKILIVLFRSYIVDVLWGQPIKLIQVASNSKLLESQRNDLFFFKIIPSHFCRASEASKIDCFKNQV